MTEGRYPPLSRTRGTAFPHYDTAGAFRVGEPPRRGCHSAVLYCVQKIVGHWSYLRSKISRKYLSSCSVGRLSRHSSIMTGQMRYFNAVHFRETVVRYCGIIRISEWYHYAKCRYHSTERWSLQHVILNYRLSVSSRILSRVRLPSS